jgi:hypothetical protein
MTTPGNVFIGDRALITTVDVDGPLGNATAPCCSGYSKVFAHEAQQAHERGEVNKAAVYTFLEVLVRFRLSFDTPGSPFVPFLQVEGKRTSIPSDLTKDDVDVVTQLSKSTNDPALRSRLFDILWVLTKDPKACAEAAASYIEAAERLNTPDNWYYSIECYHRGLYLAARLGRKKELFQKLSESLQRAARNTLSDTEEFRCCRFLEKLIWFNCGVSAEFAAIAAAHAQKAEDAGHPNTTRQYREVEADFHKLNNDAESEKSARLAAAETYVALAEIQMKGQPGNALAAASFLIAGIEALRRAGADSEKIDGLRKWLTEIQSKSLTEMKTVSTEVDISKMVESAREHVKSTDFRDAIFKFVMGKPLSDLKEIREAVIKAANDFPLTHLFPVSIIDNQGRVKMTRGSFLDLQGADFEKGLEAEMFHHVAQYYWPFRVSGFIEPARFQILNDHNPIFRDLFFLVQNHPFVPQGHEEIFLRGIHAGFHGDFLIASHLLTPQIENSIRHVLELNGVDVSNLNSDGTQPVKTYGGLFDIKETKAIFGEDMCFELRGCLIEKTGYDFRNQVAHGFVSDAQCCSVAAITVWWLVLRLLAVPIIRATAKEQRAMATLETPIATT